MKLLCLSDTVVKQMESAANLRRQYSDIELVVSCGDMPSAYLEFITSVLNVPLLYVRGNHDEHYVEEPPGGQDLHMRFVNYGGISFMGLEGCINYNNGLIQYSEFEMLQMVLKIGLRLRRRRQHYGYGIDVFVAHSPARGIHDGEDRAHLGFNAFIKFLNWYRPRYMLHGHVHTWDRRTRTRTDYRGTTVININPVTVLDVNPL